MDPQLRITPMVYDRELESEWKKSCAMLDSSRACGYLKEILGGKVARRGRGTRRFFGEAYVATAIAHAEGYYGSFQWLRNPIFLSDRQFPAGPTQAFQGQYRSALQKHFRADLESLQRNARTLESKIGLRPAAPDLWLVEPNGQHRFIEVKLPKDVVSLSQIAGLAVIASSFRRHDVSVEVVELNPKRQEEFDSFVKLLSDAG